MVEEAFEDYKLIGDQDEDPSHVDEDIIMVCHRMFPFLSFRTTMSHVYCSCPIPSSTSTLENPNHQTMFLPNILTLWHCRPHILLMNLKIILRNTWSHWIREMNMEELRGSRRSNGGFSTVICILASREWLWTICPFHVSLFY